MGIIPSKEGLLGYVERNLVQAEAQSLRRASLIRCRKAKGRNTIVHERLLLEMQEAIAIALAQLPFSAGD